MAHLGRHEAHLLAFDGGLGGFSGLRALKGCICARSVVVALHLHCHLELLV